VTAITVFNYKDISIFMYRAILGKIKLILVIKFISAKFHLSYLKYALRK